jgi:hypothetical protein
MTDTLTAADPRDSWTRDQCLMHWQTLQTKLANAKEAEMDMRKYVFKRAFPTPVEGTNTVELGNGYELKGVYKPNYSLLDNDIVDNCLNKIKKVGNQGALIADRLIGWTPSFYKSEYNKIKEDADAGSVEAVEILRYVHEMIEIKDAAPKLDIKAPKAKK